MGIYEDLNAISLMWPDKNEAYNTVLGKLNQSSILDLGIDELVDNITINERYKKYIKSILAQLCDNVDIIQYRLDIVEDLLQYPYLADTFEMVLPMLSELCEAKSMKIFEPSPLLSVVKRLGQLEIYVNCVNQISSILQECEVGLKSAALRRLREILNKVLKEEHFQSLIKNLPELKSGFECLASVTIGINLDVQLRPVEAVIISINDQKFKGEPFMERLLGNKQNKNDYCGIAEIHSILPKHLTETDKLWKSDKDNLSQALQVTLFNDLHKILKRMVEPVSAAISKYSQINGSFFAEMEPEIGFYLSAVKLINKVRKHNMDMCRPHIMPTENKTYDVINNYNINLALRKISNNPSENLKEIVIANDVTLDKGGRIFILTGPNQGGKTTYIQAVGVTQILMQAGMFVPGSNAGISPADNILTHFPVEEKPEANAGRLGEESKRLGEIFSKATGYSLVILNESLASTSPGESLYMCEDIVRGLRLLGSRAIFATHLHDLASRADAINNEIPGDSPVISMVSVVENEESVTAGTVKRTYKVIPSPPLGMSYARDIASRYGISFEQISSTLKHRNIYRGIT